MICVIQLLLSISCEQPNDTKSNMICVIRLLLSFFLGNNRMTQNPIWFVSFDFCYSFELEAIEWHKIQYDLCHLVVAIHFSCEPPNDTKSYMMCVIRLLLSIFLETTAWYKMLWFVSFGYCYSFCIGLCSVFGPGSRCSQRSESKPVGDGQFVCCV